ncbi:unannotated protein [freshwater metagenome]|uniref:Unannotated protein n=1 Tax=freshwater metagenome TaxID=449393 RepID=A0A6J6R7P4_9ZZZZ
MDGSDVDGLEVELRQRVAEGRQQPVALRRHPQHAVDAALRGALVARDEDVDSAEVAVEPERAGGRLDRERLGRGVARGRHLAGHERAAVGRHVVEEPVGHGHTGDHLIRAGLVDLELHEIAGCQDRAIAGGEIPVDDPVQGAVELVERAHQAIDAPAVGGDDGVLIEDLVVARRRHERLRAGGQGEHGGMAELVGRVELQVGELLPIGVDRDATTAAGRELGAAAGGDLEQLDGGDDAGAGRKAQHQLLAARQRHDIGDLAGLDEGAYASRHCDLTAVRAVGRDLDQREVTRVERREVETDPLHQDDLGPRVLDRCRRRARWSRRRTDQSEQRGDEQDREPGPGQRTAQHDPMVVGRSPGRYPVNYRTSRLRSVAASWLRRWMPSLR